LVILQQNQPKYIDKVLSCIENGLPLLLENLPVDIDAVLDPVLGKQTIKRGRAMIMKIGDAEVEYDSRFRLYLQVRGTSQGWWCVYRCSHHLFISPPAVNFLFECFLYHVQGPATCFWLLHLPHVTPSMCQPVTAAALPATPTDQAGQPALQA
jgi:hypothetical protein